MLISTNLCYIFQMLQSAYRVNNIKSRERMKKKDLPCSHDIEDMVLGCMMARQDNLIACIDTLAPNDFYFQENKIIFESIKKLCQTDRPVDIHILAEELQGSGLLSVVGGIPHLTVLCTLALSSPYIDTYIDILKGKTILRDIIATCDDARKKACDCLTDPMELLDESQKQICSITTSNDKAPGVTIGEILLGKGLNPQVTYEDALVARREAFKTNPLNVPISGIPTGYDDLDRMVDGLNPSTLTILAACTSVGKTALAMNIANNLACVNKIPVGIFSLEMTAHQLVHRLMCIHSGVSSTNLMTGAVTDAEMERVHRSYVTTLAAPIWIEDRSYPKINELRSKARRMVACHGIKLLIVDYLTLIEPANSRASDNRQTDVASISRALKLLSRELYIPILCLAQLSRKVDERPSHRPCLGDLRESGAIEHDADVVMFLYRRDYYDKSDRPGQAEIIIAKNRYGEIGSVNLRYSKDTSKFENVQRLLTF